MPPSLVSFSLSDAVTFCEISFWGIRHRDFFDEITHRRGGDARGSPPLGIDVGASNAQTRPALAFQHNTPHHTFFPHHQHPPFIPPTANPATPPPSSPTQAFFKSKRKMIFFATLLFGALATLGGNAAGAESSPPLPLSLSQMKAEAASLLKYEKAFAV